MRRSSMLAVCLLVAGCAPKPEAPAAPAAPSPLAAEELEAVRAVDAAWAAAMNAKDTAAVFAIYADNAKLMPEASPTLEIAAARPLLLGLMAGGSNFTLTSTEAYGIGDLAYMVGTATFTMGGAEQTVKYVEVLRKGTDGKWRYVVDMFSGVAPPK